MLRSDQTSRLRDLTMLLREGARLDGIERKYTKAAIADTRWNGERASQVVRPARIRFQIEQRVGIERRRAIGCDPSAHAAAERYGSIAHSDLSALIARTQRIDRLVIAVEHEG